MNPTYHQANFFFSTVAEFQQAVFHEDEVPVYSRGANPTIEEFNTEMAKLEGKETALSFSSGMAAISALTFSMLQAGDHVICHYNIYSWARKLIKGRLPKFGIEVTVLDEKDLKNIEKHIKPNTKLIYLENPCFMTFEEIPLKEILTLAKKKNILTAMDNTYLGPGNLKSHLRDQIDFLIHSTTKIVSGHSDVMGGSICMSKAHRKIIFEYGLMTLGGIMSPQNAMMSLRGLKSLNARNAWIKTQTTQLVDYLRKHPAIEKVNYPWSIENDWSHPDYHYPVGLFSLVMKNKTPEFIRQFADNLKEFHMAVSYGGVEAYLVPTMAFARAGHDSPFEKGLLRMSVGLRKAECLIKDIDQALKV